MKRFNYYYFLSTLNTTQGQFTYTITGLIATAVIVLNHFRWRSDSDFYDSGAHAGSFNYWQIGNWVSSYSGMSLLGLASLTQLLALVDFGVSLNIMVWTYGVGALGSFMNLISQSLLFVAYDLAY